MATRGRRTSSSWMRPIQSSPAVMRLAASLAFCALAIVRGQSAAAQSSPMLPRFRPSDVRVLNDTAWFFDATPAEHARRHPLVGFVPATGEWIIALRRWRVIDTLANHHPRSGPVTTTPTDTQHIASGFRIADARAWDDSGASGDFFLVRRDARRVRARLALLPQSRRALYARGGGHVAKRSRAPAFAMVPARWATSNGRIA